MSAENPLIDSEISPEEECGETGLQLGDEDTSLLQEFGRSGDMFYEVGTKDINPDSQEEVDEYLDAQLAFSIAFIKALAAGHKVTVYSELTGESVTIWDHWYPHQQEAELYSPLKPGQRLM